MMREFDRSPDAAPSEPQEMPGLTVCLDPACNSNLLQPIKMFEANRPDHWVVTCSCPECGCVVSNVCDGSAFDTFEEDQIKHTESVVGDLKLLRRAGMEDAVERFAAALDADAILPEDF